MGRKVLCNVIRVHGDVAIMKMGKEVTPLSAIVVDGMNSKYSKVSTVVEKSMVKNLLCH
ncbi:BURP domain-containing protein 5-like [Cucumis melo var. makuwa]|uniref:BURP domain-containing protein 5-like n=2 Tax=Cucumis melo TaxID=3656 RepID=A0A5A7ST74_CUCMM|nr:BURP domain-containing protein 5-like [Cucumis melo var. makuwa]TYK20924.1 BURP domain-containing protein 5-like [Cucumis melo var. makuwa]